MTVTDKIVEGIGQTLDAALADAVWTCGPGPNALGQTRVEVVSWGAEVGTMGGLARVWVKVRHVAPTQTDET